MAGFETPPCKRFRVDSAHSDLMTTTALPKKHMAEKVFVSEAAGRSQDSYDAPEDEIEEEDYWQPQSKSIGRQL